MSGPGTAGPASDQLGCPGSLARGADHASCRQGARPRLCAGRWSGAGSAGTRRSRGAGYRARGGRLPARGDLSSLNRPESISRTLPGSQEGGGGPEAGSPGRRSAGNAGGPVACEAPRGCSASPLLLQELKLRLPFSANRPVIPGVMCCPEVTELGPWLLFVTD